MNRLVRVGYHTELHLPPLSDQLMGTLAQISDEWLTAMGGTEKRFSLGWFEDEYIRNGPVMVVVSQEGYISAFTNIIPEYKLNESSIDMMRHRREVEPGTMDFLFISLIQWAIENKFDTFDLGLSSLAGVGEKRDSPAIEKALHYIYEHVNQFYNFKGLHEFKDKFNPTWSTRYLVYKNDASLPAIALAMIQADSGDDVIVSMLKELLFR
jgi:phosphatidylglycerol lysyltransferase